ncbi:MAG: acyltransferase [Rhizobiales bacterium]|nr:acyltransferase [Hyphomicrobiales bacterium]
MDNAVRTNSRVPVLDLLRLAAVVAVVLYHYGFWGPTSTNGVSQVAIPALAPIGQYGFLGVSVFFTISGFVIAYSAEGRSWVGFAIARFSRIYPTFVLCMTLTFAVTLAAGAGHFDVTRTQWFANLFIAAPFLGQPYVDTVYWSLVIEVVFYGWVALFMMLGWFPRRMDALILAWLAITFANELTIDAPLFEKLFIADDSGFFAVGLLIYQHYRGRRGMRFWSLFALAIGTAIFQATHRLERLGAHPDSTFDPKVVAVICIVALFGVFLATRIKRVPLPATIVLAAGGMTYPLYLLHMQMGYVIFTATSPHDHAAVAVTAIVAGIAVLAWAIWRFVEPGMHRWVKSKLTQMAARFGWSSSMTSVTVQ